MAEKKLWRVALNAYHSPEYGTSTKVIWQRVVDAISKELLRKDEAVADAYELLAMELASEEHDDIHQLIYEGCPPEPWGEVWQRYEGEAKRLISLVTKYIHPTPKATEDDEPAGYLIHYREVQSNGRVLSCTQASLDRATPAIMLPEESNVESRKLLSSRPLYLRPAPKVPAGWSLTEEMIQAACSESLSWDVHLNHADIRDLVKVLLAAAPKGE